MKPIKILLIVLSLNLISHFASAQNCHGGKVLMSMGFRGACGCNSCQRLCVSPNDVQTYLDLGWRLGECPSLGRFCCNWVRGNKTPENIQTMLASIQPNPASKSFTISFDLQKQGSVNLRVFDITGRYVATVANKTFEKAHNEIYWDASQLNTGVYYLKMTAGDYSANRKISVIN